MKRIFLIVSIALTLGSASAQGLPSETPAAVLEAFYAKFPLAKDISWTHENERYEAAFEMRRKMYFVTYDGIGGTVDQTVGINKSKLPHSIRKQLHHNYPDFTLETAARTDSTKGSIYEAEIARSEQAFILVFSNHGNLLKVVPVDGPLVKKLKWII